MGKILVKQDVPPMQMGVGGPGGGGVQVNLPMGGQKPTMREWGQLGGWKGRLGQAGKIGSWLGAGMAGMDALASASEGGSLSGAINAPVAAYTTQQTLDPSGQMMGAQQGLTNIRGQNENQQILDQAAQEKTRRENVRADRSNQVAISNPSPPMRNEGVPLPPKTQPSVPLPGTETPAPAPVQGMAQPASLPNIPKAHAQQVPAGWNPSMINQQPASTLGQQFTDWYSNNRQDPFSVLSSRQQERREEAAFSPAPQYATPAAAGAAMPEGPYTQQPPVNTAVHQSMSPATQQGAAMPEGPYTQQNTAVPPMPAENTATPFGEVQSRKEKGPWGDLPDTWGKGFVPAFMEVYGDIIKGMTPHETGSLASMVYLKMR